MNTYVRRRLAAKRRAEEEAALQDFIGEAFGLTDDVVFGDDQEHTPMSVLPFQQAAVDPATEPAAATDEPELQIEPEPDEDLQIEPEPEPSSDQPAPADTQALARLPLVEILPADFPLPILAKFVPRQELREKVDEASRYALSVTVTGPEGLSRADLALSALRTSLKAIDEHFEEPCRIANDLHKRLTGLRGEWQAEGKIAVQTVGRRVYDEQRRLEAIAAEERRKAQEDADRQARDAARREAEAAAAAKAPEPVVQELQRQAETATAPPVAASSYSPPPMKSTSTVERWKVRPKGTPADAEPNPDMAHLTPAQRSCVIELMKAVLDGRAPLILFDINYGELNRRAAAEKTTFALPGFEAFDQGGTRAKGTRAR